MRRNLRRANLLSSGIDPWLCVTVLALTCVGLLMVYSASIRESYFAYRTPTYFFYREVIWVAIGTVALTVATRIDYHRYQPLALPGLTIAVLLLALLTKFGTSVNGAQRWFYLGAGVTIEPSEIAKLAVVLYLAAWLTSKGEAVSDLKTSTAPFMLITGVILLLVLKQPDLGTATVIAATMFAIFFIAGADMKQLAMIWTLALPMVWLYVQSSSYRLARLTAFINPWHTKYGAGYHTVQVLMALGAGGIAGAGFGNGIQKNVLPTPQTDSILAVIGEELGLIGTVGILLLFLIVAYRGFRISGAAPDRFGRLLAAGLTCWIIFQALLNYAVITSSVPFTGVPLPFISYGGTSFVLAMVAMGIVLNISRFASGEARARQDSGNRGRDRRPRVPRVIDRPAADREERRRRAGPNGLHAFTPAGERSGRADPS